MRVLASVGAACLVFVAVAWPAGVLGMIDQRYCFDHESRPATTSFHEETLSLFPPGPECRFTLEDGSQVVAGPGWWPGIAAILAVLAGLMALSLMSSTQRSRRLDPDADDIES